MTKPSDRSFPGALQKAVRSLETDARDLAWSDPKWTDAIIEQLIRKPNDQRLWAVMAALRGGVSIETVHEWSRIDRWFPVHLQSIVDQERQIGTWSDPERLWQAERSGFFRPADCSLAGRRNRGATAA
ncbi:MAG: hypothetical protein R2839_11410 [Thermomicrobiales bacterium]